MPLGLSGERITQLESQTEDWITGLQLAALSIKDTTDAAKLIHTISGDDRYIADYLIDEVLSQQPDQIQQFLLQTSILKRLCADLCNAMVGIEGGQRLLETLVSLPPPICRTVAVPIGTPPRRAATGSVPASL